MRPETLIGLMSTCIPDSTTYSELAYPRILETLNLQSVSTEERRHDLRVTLALHRHTRFPQSSPAAAAA